MRPPLPAALPAAAATCRARVGPQGQPHLRKSRLPRYGGHVRSGHKEPMGMVVRAEEACVFEGLGGTRVKRAQSFSSRSAQKRPKSERKGDHQVLHAAYC